MVEVPLPFIGSSTISPSLVQDRIWSLAKAQGKGFGGQMKALLGDLFSINITALALKVIMMALEYDAKIFSSSKLKPIIRVRNAVCNKIR